MDHDHEKEGSSTLITRAALAMDTRASRAYYGIVRTPPEATTTMYYADTRRHLVCHNPTRERLLAMADDLEIPRHWLHAGRHPHIDIPVRQITRVLMDPRVEIVSPREILAMAT